MNKIHDIAKKYFNKEVTDRDRAIFEAGISLGALFHQFLGIPLPKNKKLINNIEDTIKNSISTQPYVKSVEVKIDYNQLKDVKNIYDYSVLNGENLEVEIITNYGDVTIHSRLKYIKELDFPLMYIEKIDD